MKKVSLFTVALFSGTVLFAQMKQQLVSPMQAVSRLGIRGGLNMSRFHLSEGTASQEPTVNSRAAYVGGLFLNLPISDRIRFQPEVDFSSQGAKMSSTSSSPLGEVNYSYATNLNYINVPLLIQALARCGAFIETGPQVSYLVSAKNKNTGSNTNEINIKDNIDKFDIAWSGGIGYISRVGLGIDARYNFGLKNILNNDNNNAASTFNYNGRVNNSVAQVSLIYQFGANK